MHLRRRWGTLDEIITTALQRAEPLTRQHRVNVRIEEEIPVVQVDPRAAAKHLCELMFEYLRRETLVLLAWIIEQLLVLVDHIAAGIEQNRQQTRSLFSFENALKGGPRACRLLGGRHRFAYG